MGKRRESTDTSPPRLNWPPEGITGIEAGGFKSIVDVQRIEVRPLTLLAGANSSGKSSIMQPLLLLKQTLEATYDPGPLLLSGPNVAFTSTDQLLSVLPVGQSSRSFRVGVEAGTGCIESQFGKQAGKGMVVEETTETIQGCTLRLRPGMSHDAIREMMEGGGGEAYHAWRADGLNADWAVARSRCFLRLGLRIRGGRGVLLEPTVFAVTGDALAPEEIAGGAMMEPHIRGMIHLPGLRGNPERTYPITAVGRSYPGTFEKYSASVIAQWQAQGEDRKIAMLERSLETLGLTWCVQAAPVNDTQVELRVGRLPRGRSNGKADMVSIADVGFGVSQTLPVVVALLAAEPGQAVYLEQPEIHLHPRAQVAMAEVLADAAVRGVRVITETHSSLLLLGIQSLVAEGKISPDLVKLHWFQRGEDGATHIESADLDESGAFGDWPVDFGDVALFAESRYLDAAESRERRAPRARTRVTTSRS